MSTILAAKMIGPPGTKTNTIQWHQYETPNFLFKFFEKHDRSVANVPNTITLDRI